MWNRRGIDVEMCRMYIVLSAYPCNYIGQVTIGMQQQVCG